MPLPFTLGRDVLHQMEEYRAPQLLSRMEGELRSLQQQLEPGGAACSVLIPESNLNAQTGANGATTK